ncbi:MAG: adenylate/guanylate cyclase domain-containing protein, partial [Chlorobia bacterium]|nr:adenylate/guanylate cyclase domain-containing protein [Fimbriimonadaceae bacterium]
AIGGGAAVLGAYLEMLRHKLHEDRMSRQDLLEHYFAMQERLDASEGLVPKASIFDSEFVKALLNTGPLWALLTGLVLKTIEVITVVASGVNVTGSQDVSWPVFAQLVLTVLLLLTYILAGFFAKNFWYAFLQSLAVTVGSIPPAIIGLKMFNLRQMESDLNLLGILYASLGFAVVSLFGALGGLVQRRASKELNLAQNDPAAILAEMVRIQWKLSDRRSYICVMVVDAAKSSEMKSYADPLAVEYSFREYQNLLTQLARDLNGRVHSTAGDGAVIAFASAQEAFTAAKRIQTDIERFNKEDNRLQLPFRLRIGLHMGEIVGDLDEVEFTEVIDIAAHVQAAAPVGGIAVTEEVANNLPIEEFMPLARQIDGQNVLLALNPTVEQPWQSFSI